MFSRVFRFDLSIPRCFASVASAPLGCTGTTGGLMIIGSSRSTLIFISGHPA